MEKRLKNQRKSGLSRSMEARGLPLDIINEVLLRLPVKSLVRFKCVSKPWLSLITHPQFARAHLKSNRDTNKLQSGIMLSDNLWGKKLKGYELVLQSIGGGDRENTFRKAKLLNCPLHEKGQSVIVVGHCDGILCLVINYSNIVLWNPCIRGEYRILPHPPYLQDAQAHSHPGLEVFGFGYDSLTDDYKIVRIPSLNCRALGEQYCNLQVNVLTMKTNSWRRIQNAPHYLNNLQDPIAAYGGLYWWVSFRGEKIDLILHFDFAEETFREVALPPRNEFGDNMTKLGIWGSSPCVLRDYTLWLLGEGGAWTKLMTLPEIPPPVYYCFFLEPLCVTNTGKVFIAMDAGKFVLYDPKERTYEKLEICGIVDRWIHKTVFAESLISPGTIVAELQY